eukprot:TRINITY_DN8792_c0_g1_i2.p1 TRINITY_DN8792_c0_g1~~TRINITY_DN8792_c0_g1_i2.p1  ORF type:complete len:728 (+),score=108.52 TRINITY_DN8792_c0_g1_i2:100-2184(+)
MGFSVTGVLCDGIPVPKSLYIQNKRLAFVYRVLQFAAILFAGFQIILGRSWLTLYVPAGEGFTMWFTQGDKSDLEDSSSLHCSDPAEFEYEWSDSFMYRPTGCQNVDTMRIFSKETPLSAYYMTYVQDTYLWNADGNQCGSSASTECQRQGGAYSENGASCTCKKYNDFFVKNVEMHKISFLHGYKVQTTPDKTAYQLGVSGEVTKSFKNLRTGKVDTSHGGIRTRFYDSTGNLCDMGGKTEWLADDSKAGINVRLADIVKCGKADLDAGLPELRSFAVGESGLPTMRLAGAQITLEFVYENPAVHMEGFEEDVCKVRVDVVPAWNSRTFFSPMQVPHPGTNNSEAFTTYNYGISLILKPTGSMAFLNIPAFITSLTSVIVILGLPSSIIAFLAFNVVGKYSNIYSKSATEHLDIRKRLAGIVTRQMSAMASFRSITSQQKTPFHELQDMPDSQVAELAEDIFSGLNDGSHDGGSRAHTLAQFLVHRLDLEETGGVSMNDFMTVATQNEVMTTKDIGRLAKSESASCLEKIFSDHGRLFDVGDGIVKSSSDVKPVLARQETIQIADLAEQQKKVMDILEELRLKVEVSKPEVQQEPDVQKEPDVEQGQTIQPLHVHGGSSMNRFELMPIQEKTAQEITRREMLEMQELSLKTIINRTETMQMGHQAAINRRMHVMEEQLKEILMRQQSQAKDDR